MFIFCCIILAIWLTLKLIGAGISKTGELLQQGRNRAKLESNSRYGKIDVVSPYPLLPPNENDKVEL
jgi:hypothetical protein